MTARPMTEGARLIVDLRTDGEWLRTAKHATTEIVDAGNTMLKAATEIECLSSEVRRLREALEAAEDALARAGYGRDTSTETMQAARAARAARLAALSVEGEDELATRSQGLATAPISTDTKDTTK